ncbi:MAG: imidazole glycerol phosphate synthase subunit HisH [Candidatus Margulisbacteria bacterium]|nr:imidazole glycerol phosphate synthase subunit HisH [Candidatus Margulisiibacteriota bacterium]
MTIVVIDYGMGNLHSVSKALETAGAEVLVSSDPRDLAAAERIVLPGVGSFAQGIKHLNESGFAEQLTKEVMDKGKPFLGICLGMHLAAAFGEEGGGNRGLGWIEGEVIQFKAAGIKVPHMGWDDVKFVNGSPLFSGLKSPGTLYFVHSYHFVPKDEKVVAGVCDYGGDFVAAIRRDNIHLVQFHPEKSQQSGLRILENFISMKDG